MLNFWLMTSATYLSVEYDQNETLKQEFFKRLQDKTKSKGWKFAFYFLRYIQLIVLLSLFLCGETEIDLLPNLVYICAFVVYTTFDKFYRKTSIILIIFMVFQLFGQYFFGLKYHMFIEDKMKMYTMRWLGFTQCTEYTYDNIATKTWQEIRGLCLKEKDSMFPNWHKEIDGNVQSIYFRQVPYWPDIVILIIMSMLHQINYIYKNEKEVARMQVKVYDQIKADEESSGFIYVIVRILSWIQRDLKWVCIGTMFYFNAIA
jgi:hypothetical protein